MTSGTAMKKKEKTKRKKTRQDYKSSKLLVLGET